MTNNFLFWMAFPSLMTISASIICNRMPGLAPLQRTMCLTRPDAMILVSEAGKMALVECRYQFRSSRWNCTNIDGDHVVLGVPPRLNTRETAFVYAIRSAAVTYAITVACGQGNLVGCGCDKAKREGFVAESSDHSFAALRQPQPCTGIGKCPATTTGAVESWKWGGCSADVQHGIRFARMFVDATENKRDVSSLLNKHNNGAGRKAVQNSLVTQCRCNGVSGSCTLKTCWSTLPPFRTIGDSLYSRYRNRARRVLPVLGDRSASPQHLQLCRRSTLVDNSNQGRGKIKKPRRSDLVFTVQSPDYCEHDPVSGTPGTAGRVCRHGNNSTGDEGSCEHLCCGRGYTTERYRRTWQCNCKFHWCCRVTCQRCTELADKFTCNDNSSPTTMRQSVTSSFDVADPCIT